ncbi:MAG: protein kinase [Nanoarchaeota archaeon]
MNKGNWWGTAKSRYRSAEVLDSRVSHLFSIAASDVPSLHVDRAVVKYVLPSRDPRFDEVAYTRQYQDSVGPQLFAVHNVHEAVELVLECGVSSLDSPLFLQHRLNTPERVLNAAKIIALLLKKVEDNGHVHGDISADNVLVFRRHNGLYLRLSDFEFTTTRENYERMLEETNIVFGKKAYTPPEMYGYKRGEVEPRPDLFSYGVLLWVLCAHRYPTTYADTAQQIRYVVSGEYHDKLRNVDRAAPPQLRKLIPALTERNPDNRPRHFGEVIAALS